jgi:hypothetical protein
MKKYLIILLTCFFTGGIIFFAIPKKQGVSPIAWEKFSVISLESQPVQKKTWLAYTPLKFFIHKQSTQAGEQSLSAKQNLLSKTKQLTNTSLKYVIPNEIESLETDEQGHYIFKGNQENNIRPPAQTAMALSIMLALDTVEPETIGKNKEELQTIEKKLIASLANTHIVNDGDWGECWQCAHWSFFTGFGAWLMWEDLPPETQTDVQKIIVFEADRFLTTPRYCDDCTDDSKAEENAWNANILALAAAMMPYHPHTEAWKEKNSEWMLAAFAKQSDTTSRKKIDGKRLKNWLSGWNIREEGYLYNHNRVHPDYMASALMNLWNPIVFFLAGKDMPEAAFWNMNLIYNNLENHTWDSPPYDAPGGTIYQPDKATVYYPQGTDWSTQSIDNFFMFDVQAAAFDIDNGVSIPARDWAHLRADYLLDMQARSKTGQLYQQKDQLHFYPKESKAAAWFAMSHLTLWLEYQRAWGRAIP